MPEPTIAYVIDKDYTVLSFNRAAAELHPRLEVGKKCHACLSDLSSPCPACPVAKGAVGPHSFADPIQDVVRTVDAVEMPLPDGSSGYALVSSVSSEDEAIVDENGLNIPPLGLSKMSADDHRQLLVLLTALEAGEFDIYLQPKCQISDGALVGSEALVRWIRPDGTVEAPGKFVPLLEKYGLIDRLDMVVWEKAFSTVRDWLDKGIAPLPVSVNVSRIDVVNLDVPEVFIQMAEAYDVPPRLIEIEITESAYVDDEGTIRVAEERLQSAGFHVLIDDFGTGYSSLTSLKDMNADILKLDMGFLHYDPKDAWRAMDIVHSVLDMAHKLDMFVVVEGVETKEQSDMLNLLGCQYAQGYYFYRPMPRSDFENLMDDTNSEIVPIISRGRHRSNVQRLAECFWRVAEVNVLTGVYRFIRNAPEPDCISSPRPATMEEYNARYIENGYIHPDDVEAYRAATSLTKLHSDIQRGSYRERKPFRFRDVNQWRWYVLETVPTEDYSEEEPWVLFTWREAPDDTSQHEDVHALMSAMYIQVYRFDLHTLACDVIKSQVIKGPVMQLGPHGSPLFIEGAVKEGLVHPDDAESLISFSSTDGLRDFFLGGGEHRELNFRMGRDGKWLPCIAEAKRSVDYSDQHPTILCTLREAKVSVSEAESLALASVTAN